VFEPTGNFKEKRWSEIEAGQLIKVVKDEEFPCDIVLLKADKPSGIVFVDTMNLDGETNLKEKTAPKEFNSMEMPKLESMSGVMTCDSPNEYLDKWDGNVTYFTPGTEKATINVG
jgi:magnesium-transporting ATPase (P-type)